MHKAKRFINRMPSFWMMWWLFVKLFTFVLSRSLTALWRDPSGTFPNRPVQSLLHCLYKNWRHDITWRDLQPWHWLNVMRTSYHEFFQQWHPERRRSFLTSHPWQRFEHLSPYTWPPSSPADACYLQKSTHSDVDKTAMQRDLTHCISCVALTADSTNDQNLLRAAVSHGSFCDLHQHSEQSLLSITCYF